MTLKLSERELERLLRGDEGRDLRPPEGLLARLRADLPAELPAEPADPMTLEDGGPRARVLRPAVWWRRPLVTLAASLAMMVGGSFLAWRTFREVAPPEAALAARPASAEAKASPPQLQEDTLLPPPEEGLTLDRIAASDPAENEAPKTRLAKSAAAGRDKADDGEPSVAAADGKREMQLEAAALPAPAGELGGVAGGIVGSIPGGAPGGVPGGVPEVPPETKPPQAPPPAAPSSTGVSATLPMEDEAPQPVAIPERLESPADEANMAVFENVEKPADRPKAEPRRAGAGLENPAIQGDAGRYDRDRAAALAAPRQQGTGAAGFGGRASWEPVERALVAGRWPNAAEIAAARLPKKKNARVEGAKGSFSDSKENDAEARRTEDSASALHEDLLDFFGSQHKTARGLLELRRRALHLAGSEPVDPEVAELVRALNFAARIATPIN